MITNPSEDYARGWVPFLGVRIRLDSHPLIPRVETEYGVEKAIALIPSGSKVLDLFAGSGAIGIAVLAQVSNARVDFGEIEERHFPSIKKSLQENDIDPSRTRMIPTNVWSDITDRYDVILANPPYIDIAAQNPELSAEPPEALYAEDGGFALIEKTLRGAREHLNQRGSLWIEHDPAQTPRIHILAKTMGCTATTHTDQFGFERYSVIL